MVGGLKGGVVVLVTGPDVDQVVGASRSILAVAAERRLLVDSVLVELVGVLGTAVLAGALNHRGDVLAVPDRLAARADLTFCVMPVGIPPHFLALL